MYSPKFEDDFLKHIPAKYKQVYLQFLLRNVGLFAESEKNERRQKFLYTAIKDPGTGKFFRPRIFHPFSLDLVEKVE